MPLQKHESKSQPGLFFWAEANGGGAGADESYAVVSQMTGFPATEAHDDWFYHFKDANEIAKQLANE
jgi:hypothetical protein